MPPLTHPSRENPLQAMWDRDLNDLPGHMLRAPSMAEKVQRILFGSAILSIRPDGGKHYMHDNQGYIPHLGLAHKVDSPLCIDDRVPGTIL